MIKRILNAVGKRTKDAHFQQKAVKKMEEIEKGEKILAPKVPTEEKRFKKALGDSKVKEVSMFRLTECGLSSVRKSLPLYIKYLQWSSFLDLKQEGCNSS